MIKKITITLIVFFYSGYMTYVSAQCTATISASASSVCSGQPVIFTVFTQGCAGAQFLWSNGRTVQSFTDTVFNSGTAPLILTYSVTVTSPGGTTIAYKNVTVKPIPVLTISNNSPVVCNNDTSAILLSSATAGAVYSWTALSTNLTGAVNGNGNKIAQVLTNTTTANGTAIYTVTPSYSGCVGNPKSDSVVVYPVPQLTVINNSPVICSNANINIQLSSSLPGSTFHWVTSPSQVLGATAGSGTSITDHLWTTTNDTSLITYTVTTVKDGCAGTSLQVPVIVKPLPQLFVSASNPSVCNGDSVVIMLSAIPASAFINWTVSSANVTGGMNGSGTLIQQQLSCSTPPSTINYYITANMGGCESEVLNTIVTVKRNPDAFFAPAAPTICSGSSANVYLNSNPTGASFEWAPQWTTVTGASAGNGPVINQLLSNTTGQGIDSVTYNVIAEKNGCFSDTLTVNVKVKPIPIVTLSEDSSTICSGTYVTIQLNSVPQGANLTWTAFADHVNGYSGGTGNLIHQLLSVAGTTGNVNYNITPSLNQCYGNAMPALVEVHSCLGVISNDIKFESEMSVFMNETERKIEINYFLKSEKKITVNIYSCIGVREITQTSFQSAGSIRQLIDTSALKQGVYFAELLTGQNRLVKKVIVN